MHVVVELWRARPLWLQRSHEEQAAYFQWIIPHIRDVLAEGGELVAIGAADQRCDPDYDYWAIWRFHDQDCLLNFAHAIEIAGWHEFFDRVNAGVEGRAWQDILHVETPSRQSVEM